MIARTNTSFLCFEEDALCTAWKEPVITVQLLNVYSHLTICLKMYPGFALIMPGKTHRHRNDCGDGHAYAQVPRNRRHTCHTGPLGKHQRWSGGSRRVKRKCGANPLLWCLWEGLGEVGQTGLGLLCLNNSLGSC